MTLITKPRWKMLLFTEYWGKGYDNDRLIEAIEEHIKNLTKHNSQKNQSAKLKKAVHELTGLSDDYVDDTRFKGDRC